MRVVHICLALLCTVAIACFAIHSILRKSTSLAIINAVENASVIEYKCYGHAKPCTVGLTREIKADINKEIVESEFSYWGRKGVGLGFLSLRDKDSNELLSIGVLNKKCIDVDRRQFRLNRDIRVILGVSERQ